MYVTIAEVRPIATQMTATALPDATLTQLIVRASRMFDLSVGVEPGYFESVYYPVWQSLHVYAVGDIVTPTTRNLQRPHWVRLGSVSTPLRRLLINLEPCLPRKLN